MTTESENPPASVPVEGGPPSRPLPSVRVGPGPAGHLRVRVRPADTRATRGRPDEVVVEAGADGPDLVVDLADTAPRAGWAGAVDEGLGHRRAGAALARHLSRPGAPTPVLDPVPGRPADVVLGYLLAAHRQDTRSARPAPSAPDLYLSADPDGVVAGAVAAATATALARDLAGCAPDLASPATLAGWAASTLSGAGMDVEVLDEAWLVEGGFGGILAVGGGSSRPPRLVVARRRGRGPGATRVLLVGKGVTFDTGGISIKPAENMHLMRTDMAGGAAVVAAAAAFCGGGDFRGAEADLDLTVLVPFAENMVSGSAYRPGDVVTHRGGVTSEVTNTDAEGRMVLADALAYGVEIADPHVVVDAATLTGAMKIALGMRTGAVLGNDDDLARRLSEAGAAAGERWWRLPLPDDLRDSVRSTAADRKQAPWGPGSIAAALFLEGFVDGRPWAHLDIAGPARAEKEIDEVAPVATGFATRSLIGLLRGLVDEPRR